MTTHILTLLALYIGLAAALAQPVITNQPRSQTNIAGAAVTFSVGATGAPPLSYQWSFNSLGNPLPGATNDMLILPNVQASNGGIYRVVITNDSGSVRSAIAFLTVLLPPGIVNQPASQLAELGDPITFSVRATGTQPLSYLWQFNGGPLAGQTRTNLTLTSVQSSNAGMYSVVITNLYGAITSQVATLTLGPPMFTKVTTGDIVNDGGFGFGCAWGDYNNDGLMDLFVCNVIPPDFLYRNNADGTFTRITTTPPVNSGSWAFGAAWGDYDNDGNLDLFVFGPRDGFTHGPNRLYHNDGNGTFTSVTNGLLVTELLYSHGGVWADFDNDGLIDLFVANVQAFGSTVPALDNYLYRNTGGESFERISFGPKSLTNGNSWNVAAADFNNDGWVDLFVPQGGTRVGRQNSLLYGNNQNGTFSLLTNSVIFTDAANSEAGAWGDYDNDGFLDLFVSTFYGQNNLLYHNNGDGTFTSVTNSPVTLDGGWSVGCAWSDYDNDGWLDLFVANLGRIDLNTSDSIAPEINFLYHNNGDGTFTRVSGGILVNELSHSTGCAWADYDNDGFPDLFVSNGWTDFSENNFLYRNQGNSNNWITFKLVGTASNRSAIGAKVRVRATVAGRTFWQMREISGGSNYGSQNDMRPSFGLGDATNVDTVRIEWPSGTVQEFHDVASKQFLTITEPPRLLAGKTNGVPQFTIMGGRGFSYRIETSTNLPDWSTLGTVTITNRSGTALIIDSNTPDARSRFYRGLMP